MGDLPFDDLHESQFLDMVPRGAFNMVYMGDNKESIEIGPASDEYVVSIDFHVDTSTGTSCISEITRIDREIDPSAPSILQRLKRAGVDPALSDLADDTRMCNEN